ncbi:MAG: Spy/CpxP family protein refolding chaperone, partial [Terriglobales bacterium]
QVLLLAVCSLLGTAFAQKQQAVPASEPAAGVFFEEPIPPGDVLFTVPVAPPDMVMMAGTPAPQPPAFVWQAEQGERISLRHPHGGPELGKWWKDSKIVTDLKLTPAQITQIEQAFFDHRLKLIELRADLEREETRLQPLIEADQPDQAKVSAQIDLVLAARGRLEKAHIMMMLALRRSLSVEQWKKLEAIKQERESRWGEHTPMAAPRAPRFHFSHPAQPANPPQPASPSTPPKPGDRM